MINSLPIHTFAADEFIEGSAQALKDQIEEQLKESDYVTVALSGGSSPLPVYEKLSAYDLPWNRIGFFLVDERCTPNNAPDSNYGNIKEVFFQKISSEVFPIIQEGKSYEDCATDYGVLLHEKLKIVNGFPSFDLLVLGMGLDGHIASLFPDTEALKEETTPVVLNGVPQLNTERITITYPVILNSTSVVLLIKGEEKRSVLSKALQETLPVSRVINKVNLIFN